MMTINKNKNGSEMILELVGRLDTNTAPQLEKISNDSLKGIEKLTLDFQELAYISSAGLRVILQMQKAMNLQGKMAVKNVNEEVMEVFEVTGFTNILDIQE